jgi:hypothetical protein
MQMRVFALAVALLASVACAKAKECPSIYSDGYTFLTSGDVWVNDAGATLKYVGDKLVAKSKSGTRVFDEDVEVTNPSFVISDNKMPPDVGFYRVRYGNPHADFVSPDLAKWTGGSAIFVRKCK